MADDFLGNILSSVLGAGAQGQQGLPGGLGGLGGGLGGLGAALGGLGAGGLGGALGSVFGRSAQDEGGSSVGGGAPLAGKGAILAMLLPLAMQWVQRNGGVGAVLDRFRQQGHGQQVASWVSTGQNEPVSASAVSDVVGDDELSRLSQQLGVPQDEVAHGFAQILPQVVNHLTPQGDVPGDADDVLGAGLASIEKMFGSRG
jgi:uncharacterized protein YidB (DUF937 family)